MMNLLIKITFFTENKISKDEPQTAPKPNKDEEKEIVEEVIDDADEDKDDEDKDVDEDAAMDVSDDDQQSNDATESLRKNLKNQELNHLNSISDYPSHNKQKKVTLLLSDKESNQK